MKVKTVALITALFLLISSLFFNFLFLTRQSDRNPGELVTEVVDGDTFLMENKQPVRFYGLNAPEIDVCYGKEAQEELKKLIGGKRVILREPEVDRFRRIMALVYTGGTLVNAEMLKKGAAVYEGQGGSAAEELRRANKEAREKKVGIFSSLCTQKENLENPQCSIKGNIERVHNTKKYHLPGCKSYNETTVEKYLGEQWFCTEEEAMKAGYIKVEDCH